MTRADLRIRGGIVVNADGRRTADVIIAGGKIVEIVERGSTAHAHRELDASGCFVLPGAVDAHVHLDGPPGPEGPGFVDGFLTGTRAAVHGGVTTVGHMSFSDGDALREVIRRDAERADRDAIIDYVLHPGIYRVTKEALEDIPELARTGAGTLKLVTLALDDDGAAHFGDAMAAAGKAGMLTMIHCEDGAIIDHATHALHDRGRAGLRDYPDSRPVVSESAAIERAVAIAEVAGAPVYIVHLSSARGLEAVRAARRRGIDVSVETRPMYLYLTREAHEQHDGARFIGMPPLRERGDLEALWAGIADGSIDTVATDHAPWMLRDKVDPSLSLETSRKGTAELDTFLPLLFDRGVRTGRIELERLVAVTATNPARLLGIHPRKGTLAVGADADVVIFDPQVTRTVHAEDLETASDHSVYEGWSVTGWPRHVLSRGELVFDRGRIPARPGRGRRLLAGRARTPVDDLRSG